MPPAKPNPKSVAQAASKARFVNLPRLSVPPNYKQWLNGLLETNQNRKSLVSTEKIEIDDLLRQQAGQQFKNDNNLLKKALAETTTKASIDAWTDAKARAARFSHHVAFEPVEPGPLTDQVMELSIPGVAAHASNSGGRAAWSLQTYKSFAAEAKKKNPGVSFSKDLMDLAFHISTTRMPKHTDQARRRDKQAMIDRCLGKESERYWKDAL